MIRDRTIMAGRLQMTKPIPMAILQFVLCDHQDTLNKEDNRQYCGVNYIYKVGLLYPSSCNVILTVSIYLMQ